MYIRPTRIVLLFFVLVAFSCGKRVELEHPEFIGFWQGSDSLNTYTLEILTDGSATYTVADSLVEYEFTGFATYKEPNLFIGAKKLNVNAYPFKMKDLSGEFNWQTTIDSVDLFAAKFN